MAKFGRDGRRGSQWYLAVLWGGLIAGVVDISAAFLNLSRPGFGPMRILQGIASGLLGRESFNGGWVTAALGLACHFAITFGAAATYFAVSRWMRVLVTRPVICGLLYGIPVYAVTNFVIVPLSRIGRMTVAPPLAMLTAVVILMVGVGLPIGLMARRYSD
jgi:hypothetical protein